MSPSEIASAVVMGLILWGFLSILLKWVGWISWAWYWVMLPFFLAVALLICMLIIAMALGGKAK